MDKSQALRLLHSGLGEEYGDDLITTDLVSALDYMPLAITQAATFIKRRAPRMSVSAYLEEFRRSDKKKASLLNRDGGDLRRDDSASNSIVTTWQITFEQIRREQPSAADLLSFMSFFNPQGIPEFALQAYTRDYRGDVEDKLTEDLEVLRSNSLVVVTAESDVFEMHALVQFCMRAWLSSGNRQRRKWEFLKIMADQYPSGEYENWTKCQRLDPHIEATVKKEQSEDVLAWASLLTNVGWYRWKRGMYKEARAANQQALEIRERLLGRQHRDALRNVYILAIVLGEQGKYEEAEKMSRQVLSIREIRLGKEHLTTLRSANTLALILQRRGKNKEAEQMSRQVLGISEIQLGREHPSTLTSASNLASILQSQGKYEEAEQMSRQVLGISEIRLGKEHPITLTSTSNLASILHCQGKYKEAEQMNRRALGAREMMLGSNHPDTLESVYSLAYLFHKQTRFLEAALLYERACNGFTDALGPDHPTTKACVAYFYSLREEMAKEARN